MVRRSRERRGMAKRGGGRAEERRRGRRRRKGSEEVFVGAGDVNRRLKKGYVSVGRRERKSSVG